MAINSTSTVLFLAVCRYCNIKPLPYTVNASTLFLQIAQVQIKPVYTSYQSLGCTIVFSCIPLPHVCRYCWLSETGYLPDYPLLLPIKLVRPWLPVSPRQFVLPDMLVTALWLLSALHWRYSMVFSSCGCIDIHSFQPPTTRSTIAQSATSR